MSDRGRIMGASGLREISRIDLGGYALGGSGYEVPQTVCYILLQLIWTMW